jgi:hypothetical protein
VAILVKEEKLRKMLTRFIDDASWLEDESYSQYAYLEKRMIDAFIEECRKE